MGREQELSMIGSELTQKKIQQLHNGIGLTGPNECLYSYSIKPTEKVILIGQEKKMKPTHRNKLISVFLLMLLVVLLTTCVSPQSSEIIIPMNLVYQHKDSTATIQMQVGTGHLSGYGLYDHPWNGAAGPDNVYGNILGPDDCEHCSTYCAPASIAMMADAYGISVEQDYIYDSYKIHALEINGDNVIQTHGLGMDHGGGTPSTQPEVQNALSGVLGMGYDQHSVPSLDWMKLKNDFIEMKRPVLWLDLNGWPENQYNEWPADPGRANQGHAKVIAGYDDRGTADPSDDLSLIYDPWPEYNDKSKLPLNAIKGPQDTFDPYWLPTTDVLSDTSDIFLIPVDPIP
jgi:hypothetical protein